MAFYALRFEPGDRILTTTAEYASNYIALRQVANRTGATISVIPNDETGQVDVDALAAMLDERVKAVSLVHVPTQGGLVNPARAVADVTRAAGVPLLLDARQSIGQIPIDVRTIGCDILSATGRKFLCGPRGTGFLYVRRELLERLEPPLLDLHAAEWLPDGGYRIRPDARRFENWEANYAAKIGLGVAAEYAVDWGLDAIRTRVYAVADDLRERLGALPGVSTHDLGRKRCGIVTFAVDSHDPQLVADALRAQAINVSVSLGAYSRLDFGERGLTNLVRASVHYDNTEGELDQLTNAISPLAPRPTPSAVKRVFASRWPEGSSAPAAGRATPAASAPSAAPRLDHGAASASGCAHPRAPMLPGLPARQEERYEHDRRPDGAARPSGVSSARGPLRPPSRAASA
jgi:selenocysteine lyase/cysteine desulfurase